MRKSKCPIGTIRKRTMSLLHDWNGGRFDMMPCSGSLMAKRHMDSHEKDRLFQKGLDAFNSAHFYDAHEHWEEIWLETPNPEKLFLQGLIQVAAAFHHHSRENFLGCRNLLRAGLIKLDQFPPAHSGLAIEPLRASVRVWIVDLESGESTKNSRIPTIKSHGTTHKKT